jgi:GAF domain-containing protein
MNTDITARKHAEEALRESETEQQFIAQVATILASTINYEETLSRVADLVVRELADCCIMDFVEEEGQVRRAKVVHRDPAMAPVTDVLQRINLDSKRPHLASVVLEERNPLLMTEVTDDYLASIAQTDEHLHALRQLAPKSLMAVPLMEQGRLLGSLLFIRTSSDDPYQPNDLRLAEELARRAALAVHKGT